MLEPVDLRSDLLSRPTEAIIAAMESAMRSPGAFGLRENNLQREMEALAAEMLGKEDALLFPTCTMANQVALSLLTHPGSIVVAQSEPHILFSEAGAPAVLSGLAVRSLTSHMPTIDEWRACLAVSADELRMPVEAISLENTHNRSGGVPLDLDLIASVLSLAREHGISAHLDGARLPNAAVATDKTLAEVARGFDTISLCLNKGLCAPIGSVLAGPAELIKRALVTRQRLGGGLRPTGIVAAAGLAALRNFDPIGADHRRAHTLAGLLANIPDVAVDVPPTNIVLLKLNPDVWSAENFCSALAGCGVLALPFGTHTVRFVTYNGISDNDISRTADVVLKTVKST